MVAASILKARGFDQVIDVANGWKDLENTALPKSAYACPTTIDQEVLDQAVQSALSKSKPSSRFNHKD